MNGGMELRCEETVVLRIRGGFHTRLVVLKENEGKDGDRVRMLNYTKAIHYLENWKSQRAL